jgi:hypothetical protein
MVQHAPQLGGVIGQAPGHLEQDEAQDTWPVKTAGCHVIYGNNLFFPFFGILKCGNFCKKGFKKTPRWRKFLASDLTPKRRQMRPDLWWKKPVRLSLFLRGKFRSRTLGISLFLKGKNMQKKFFPVLDLTTLACAKTPGQ